MRAILGVIRRVRSTGTRHSSGGYRRARPRAVLIAVIGGIFVGRSR
jgi:hypothetical protein